MPLWSQGFKVCVHPPLTDEPRIALEIGDQVNVTRWRRHWLFGEKVQEETEVVTKNGKKSQKKEVKTAFKKRSRGWFPRQCAELAEEDFDSEAEDIEKDENDKKKK